VSVLSWYGGIRLYLNCLIKVVFYTWRHRTCTDCCRTIEDVCYINGTPRRMHCWPVDDIPNIATTWRGINGLVEARIVARAEGVIIIKLACEN
jgi:hypothetical protein